MNRRIRRKLLKRACAAYYVMTVIELVRESVPIEFIESWPSFWARQPHRPRPFPGRVPIRLLSKTNPKTSTSTLGTGAR